MAVRISRTNDLSKATSPPTRSTLLRKLVLVFLLVIVAAFGLVAQIRQHPDIPSILWTLFAELVLGLVAGLGARFVMRQRHGLLRFLVALNALILGLLIVGWLTDWQVGMQPLYFGRKDVDWVNLTELAISIPVILAALLAWRKPASIKTGPAIEVAPQPAVDSAPVVPNRPSETATLSKIAQPRIAVTSALEMFTSRRRVAGKSAISKVTTRNRLTGKSATGKSATKPKKLLQRKKPKVNLSPVEKHLCPFCLEAVTRHDPRGVVTCEICHTLHHADCWEIAGSCQVPHYTA
jgi:ribosomal protein L37AE/L43A